MNEARLSGIRKVFLLLFMVGVTALLGVFAASASVVHGAAPSVPSPVIDAPSVPSPVIQMPAVQSPDVSETLHPKENAENPPPEEEGFWGTIWGWIKSFGNTVADGAKAVFNWIGENWQVVATVVLGIVLVVVAIVAGLEIALALLVSMLVGAAISGIIGYIMGSRGEDLLNDILIGGILGAFSMGLLGAGLRLFGHSLKAILSLAFVDGALSSFLENLLRGQKLSWSRALLSGIIGVVLVAGGMYLADLISVKWFQSGVTHADEAGGVVGSGKTIDQSVIEKILSIKKGERPDPATYLSQDYITSHLSQFEGGVTKISASSPNGVVGPPGGTFVMPKTVADKLIAESGGDVTKLEKLLSLEPGTLGSNPVRIDITSPSGLRMPSGNELGANSQWIPGGYTGGGIPEATIDPAPPGTYTVSQIFK
jgi:hypothetical protein